MAQSQRVSPRHESEQRFLMLLQAFNSLQALRTPEDTYMFDKELTILAEEITDLAIGATK